MPRSASRPLDGRLPALERALLAWYRRAGRDLPWRRHRDPYRILVAEVMLQQTTVRAVIPYYRRFLRRFPTLRSLARAPEARVLAVWSGLGYYRRARSLRAAARRIAARHRGRFPRGFADILALPGVGPYTAGAIASIAFGERRPILDGNVARVLARLFLIRGVPGGAARTRRLWDLAERLVALTSDPGGLNQALMDLGATVCLPARPTCPACPVAAGCAARAAGLQDRVPAPQPRRAAVALRAAVLLAERDGRYLMRRRAGTGLMDGLWEFPAVGFPDGIAAGGAGRRRAGRTVGGLRAGRTIARLRHTITHRRYEVMVRRARLLAGPPDRRHRWFDPASIATLPQSSLVAKILARIDRPGPGPASRRPRARRAAAVRAGSRSQAATGAGSGV